VTSLGQVLILVVYTLLGGWIFMAIEAPAENLDALNMNQTRVR
jgi:hypothetical protein